jgi:hypothetical protein
VKNDLIAREDIKEVIMRPIWSRFDLRKPKVEIDDTAEACQKAFGTVCSFIGTRDLIQEHITFRVRPLVESWEIPKETITKSSEGDMVRLKYTFRYGDKFDEPNDDWLKCIEATSDELLGAYSKEEDNALSAAFGGRGRKRMNKVFDTIDFVYPDYRYPLRGQGKKRKAATLAAPAKLVPKAAGKKMKVLTHRPRYIEPAVVPEFGGEASSAAETRETIPPAQRTKEPAIMPKAPSVHYRKSLNFCGPVYFRRPAHENKDVIFVGLVADEYNTYFRGPINVFVGRPTKIRKLFSSATRPTKISCILVGRG